MAQGKGAHEVRGLSQGFQQGQPPFSQQPHRGAVTEDASVSITRRRAAVQRVQSRPRLIDGASTAKSAAPRRPRPAGGGLSHSDPGPGDGQGAAPRGSPSPLSPRQGDRVMQDRSSLDGPPSPKRRWASRGPQTVRPPRATSAANTQETRLPCWWPGQHRVGLGAPRTPFPGTEHSPPWGCPSVPPPAALLASAGPPLKSAGHALTRETPPDAAVFRIWVFATSFGHELCAKGLVSIPVCPPPLPLLELTPAYSTPTPRRTREASRARWKTA